MKRRRTWGVIVSYWDVPYESEVMELAISEEWMCRMRSVRGGRICRRNNTINLNYSQYWCVCPFFETLPLPLRKRRKCFNFIMTCVFLSADTFLNNWRKLVRKRCSISWYLAVSSAFGFLKSYFCFFAGGDVITMFLPENYVVLCTSSSALLSLSNHCSNENSGDTRLLLQLFPVLWFELLCEILELNWSFERNKG
jgi:hypothetical protein